MTEQSAALEAYSWVTMYGNKLSRIMYVDSRTCRVNNVHRLKFRNLEGSPLIKEIKEHVYVQFIYVEDQLKWQAHKLIRSFDMQLGVHHFNKQNTVKLLN